MCDKSEEKKILQDLVKEIRDTNLQITKSNETNKREREELTKQIEELKKANEHTIEKLEQVKKENQTMKITIEKLIKHPDKTGTEEEQIGENHVTKLNKEIEELKEEMQGIKKKYKYQNEDKHNLTNQPAPPPPFQSREELMTHGFQKFIENNINNRLAVPNSTYEEWYGDVHTKLRQNIPCLFEKYIFMKVKFNEKYNIVRWNSHTRSDNDKLKVTISYCSVKTYTYNEEWDHEHTEYTVLLHPNEPNKALELEPETSRDDYNGFMTDQVTEDYYSVKNELILCCKKR